MQNLTYMKEGCEDIYAEAVEYNKNRPEPVKVSYEVIDDKSKGKKAAKAAPKKAAKEKK